MELMREMNGFLYDEVAAAEIKLRVELSPHSKIYVLDLLRRLTRDHELFTVLDDQRPLAAIMLEAMHKNIFERCRDLRLIGDLSLVFSGLYPEHLTRRLMEIDYFISLGRRSYRLLSDACSGYQSRRELAVLYFQLFSEFLELTGILTELAANLRFMDENDTEKAIRRWHSTSIGKYLEILCRRKVVPLRN